MSVVGSPVTCYISVKSLNQVAGIMEMTSVHEEVRTFAYLHAAAGWALEQAESSRDCCMFPSIHAILASVHCLEAFANHLGPRYLGEVKWDKRAANLESPNEKIKALLDRLQIPLAEVQADYDSYMLGLRIRKTLTHGRTHEINKGHIPQLVEGSVVSSAHPEWHRLCAPKTARRVFEAVTALIDRMAESSGDGRGCWGILGRGF
jgi:hypothetical protein